MCDERNMGFFWPMLLRGMHHGPMKFGGMCCSPGDQSKETRIKQLEALKSQLQDHINSIDEKINELETAEKVEA
ncbi:MAG: hypothetical protein ACFFF4_04600 [Candidatus Thorarchaeota archaeon]